ncbi:hypothetical protein CC78DRAFT_588085 [Lojkania enalia]|uniref:Uncharacterized protein n=1 Tax=Lojkania enalia TaxID=147567 RepID=A0A9P4K054_9PLEO|nr:hypothetical protein CC78DRAFT_588085 [Didymosphaeria enalia]
MMIQRLYDNVDGTLRCRLEHVTKDDFRHTCRVFPTISSDALWESGRRIALGEQWGLNLDFKPRGHQLVAVAVAIIKKNGDINYIEVERDRLNGRTDGHLPQQQRAEDICPSASNLPIPCRCDLKNRDLFPRPRPRGTAVVIVPPAALRSWKDDAGVFLKGGTLMAGKYGLKPRIAFHAPHYDDEDFPQLRERESEWCEIVAEADWSHWERHKMDATF